MIFHENRLWADNFHETSYLIFFFKLGKMSQNLSSAAVMIGTLRVKYTGNVCELYCFVVKLNFDKKRQYFD